MAKRAFDINPAAIIGWHRLWTFVSAQLTSILVQVEREETMQGEQFATLLGQLIAAEDSGRYDTLSFDDVFRHLQAGSIYGFLVIRFGRDLDLSIFDQQGWAKISDQWRDFASSIEADSEFGVERNGICLLMAYALESLQLSSRVISSISRESTPHI